MAEPRDGAGDGVRPADRLGVHRREGCQLGRAQPPAVPAIFLAQRAREHRLLRFRYPGLPEPAGLLSGLRTYPLGLPAWGIGAVLACIHALVVWPLDRIARLFWPGTGNDFWMRSLALALSCIAPVFLIHVGTTSIDPFTSLCVAGPGPVARARDSRRREPQQGVAAALLGWPRRRSSATPTSPWRCAHSGC